ncbi:MAG TPA: protein kinase [Polyangiaceae bacterium]
MLPKPGDTVDRFVLEALVGQGGMGAVYRARDPKLQRRVALKVLRVELTGETGGTSSEGTARLLREARAAASLDHPNAVSIYDVGEHDGLPYIAMELVEGKSLRAFVGDAAVPVGERLRLLVDVARALAAAHKRGLVHRDVKPENVMVRVDGVVKVLDFGIARRHAAPTDPHGSTTPEGLATITQEGAVLGTPLYMAPEQIRGDALDGRADQFAWGVMAYELLTGKVPWVFERDAFRLVAAILTSTPEPLGPRAPGVPGAVASAVERAIAKEPSSRFATMDHLVAAVEAATTSPDALARTEVMTPSDVPPSRAPAPRRRAAVWGAMAVVGAGVVFAGASALHGPASPPNPSATGDPAPPEPAAVTDLPAPPSASPEALVSWREAMQAFRDGASALWVEYMRRALAADPSLAAAHLRMAWATEGSSPSDARQHFTAASHLRALLSPRDAELLDAAEPYFFRQPSDVAEFTRRLEAVVAHHPHDAELLFYLSRAYADSGEMETSTGLLARAVESDPKFAMALGFLGVDHAYLGDVAASESAFTRCLEASPGATICLQLRSSVDELEGRCDRMEQAARGFLAIDPSAPSGLGLLAQALQALGRPREAVRATLEQRWAHLPESIRAGERLVDGVHLAEIEGDFASAERQARDLQAAVASPDDADGHARAAWLLVQVYAETGNDSGAREVAERFMAQRAAWASNPRGEDWALAADVVPLMLAAERRGGSLDEAAFTTQRDAWLADWEAKLPSFYSYDLWLRGFAANVDSEPRARQATEAMPRFGTLRAYGPILTASADEGHAWLLAGDAKKALPLLERATRQCTQLREPLASGHALLWLGQAREAMADKPGACTAYRAVLSRWPRSSRSRTAATAFARASTLGC